MINYCRDGGRSKRGATLVRGSSTSLVLRFYQPNFKAHLIQSLARVYYFKVHGYFPYLFLAHCWKYLSSDRRWRHKDFCFVFECLYYLMESLISSSYSLLGISLSTDCAGFLTLFKGGGEPGALQSASKNHQMFKTKGVGVKGVLNNVKKNCTIGREGHPLTGRTAYISWPLACGGETETVRNKWWKK